MKMAWESPAEDSAKMLTATGNSWRFLTTLLGERLVAQFFQTAPNAVGSTKELIRHVGGAEINKDLIAYTANHIATIRQTDEGREGTGAFLQKRKPWWQS